MTSSSPLITIGITCFNAQDLIIDAVKHACQQDWPNYEIVVVDDGSSDNSVKILSEYIAGKDNITLIQHEKNKGFPSALNTIIENAKGEYITFFDDDDISTPDRLTKQHARLSKYIEAHNTQLVMCYTNRNVTYANDEKEGYSFTAIGAIEGKEPHGPMVADYILWHSGQAGYAWGMFGSCTLMVHRNLFNQLGGFDANFRRNTEWDMAIRCAMQDGHFISVPEPLVVMTKTPTPDKSGTTPLKYSLMLRKKYKDYLQSKNLYFTSRLIARSRFHGGKARKYTSLAYYGAAAISAPCQILFPKLKSLLKAA